MYGLCDIYMVLLIILVHLFFLFVSSYRYVCFLVLTIFLWYIWQLFDFVAHSMTGLLWSSSHSMDNFMLHIWFHNLLLNLILATLYIVIIIGKVQCVLLISLS